MQMGVVRVQDSEELHDGLWWPRQAVNQCA